MDLSNNYQTRFPYAIHDFVEDMNLTRNWIRLLPTRDMTELRKVVYARKEVDLSSNPLTCFHGAQALAWPAKQTTAQNIIVSMQLLRYLIDYSERLEECIYRGMKLIFLGPIGCGKQEFINMLMTERGLEFRQRINPHSLRMRRWLDVFDYFLDVKLGATNNRDNRSGGEHKIVHASSWKFSGSIRHAIIDFAFIRHEHMIVNLMVNLAEYSADFQYETLGLWLDMVMTYSSTSCIIIPICMFGEELAREKDASAYARQIEKYLSAFLCFREKEYKQILEEMETIGEAKMSQIAAAKLRALRTYKSRLPLIHENSVRIW